MAAGDEPRTATGLSAAVRCGDRRAADGVAAALARIAHENPRLGAFLAVDADAALAVAERIDQRRARGERLGRLCGVPIALKDNLLAEGRVAACGSRMLEHFVAPYSATVVQRLLAEDAVLIGRSNMDEFGMGSSTEHSAFFPTVNPWDPARVPGGSSGGAAAAVAADLCPLAFGSDTGGSVRQPAALCGVSGLKPTYGRLSRFGLVAYASSLDCVGLIARTAADLALGLLVAGRDPADATSLDLPPTDFAAALPAPPHLRGLRIGVLADDSPPLDPEVDAACRTAVQQLAELGATVVPVALPHLRHAVATYYLIAAAEASSNLARYDGVRYGRRADGRTLEEVYANSRSQGFGQEVQQRILLGTFALQHGYHDAMYGQATRVRALLRRDFAAAFAQCDAIATPTSPLPAWLLGQMREDPVAMYRCDSLTVPASLAGLPALSMPCGFTRNRLPIGLQLCAPSAREDLLLRLCDCYQQHTDWHRQRPQP